MYGCMCSGLRVRYQSALYAIIAIAFIYIIDSLFIRLTFDATIYYIRKDQFETNLNQAIKQEAM